jgi:hypothetical protein
MNNSSEKISKEEFFSLLEEINQRSKSRTEELEIIIDEAEKELIRRKSLGENI